MRCDCSQASLDRWLGRAIEAENVKAARMLLRSGADARGRCSETGKLFISLAASARNNRYELISVLVAHGANPNAPVFRTLLQRYRADVLEEELIEGVRVSHPMPEFQFNPQGTDALIAYLRSIQETPPAQ